jgi:hypothetical protein
MRRAISITTQARSIVIIQGAYEKFCVPATVGPTVYSGQELFQSIATAEPAALATTQEDWLIFKRLVKEWQEQRGAMSSITEAVLCPAYQSIIGMGADAVRFIFAQLLDEGDEPDQWFWALKAITGADPVKDEDRGDFVKMGASWLEWAKNEGYAW